MVYAIIMAGSVHVIHGFKKATRAAPKRNIEIARRRLKEVQK